MKKLKIILQSKYFFAISLLILILFVFIKTKVIKYESIYQDESYLMGKVIKINKYDDKIKLLIKAKEKIIATYYTNEKQSINLGDTIYITGKLNEPPNNTIPNTFNYKKYLYNNHIYKTFTIKSIKPQEENTNILYKIKTFIIKRCNNNPYLSLFVIGDKSLLESETYNSYKDIGVAHLLAISGMHVSMFILILNKLLFFIPKKKREILISIFLIFYSFVVDFSVSILRTIIFYILGRLNLNLSNFQKLYLTFIILLLIDPFYIYNTAFIYSFITVLGIILTSKYLTKNYFKNIIIISFYSMLFTLPITINLNYEINILSLASNLILIPMITFFIYPFSLITFTFPIFEPIYSFFISIMENISIILNKITIFKIIIPKLSTILIVIYYFLLITIIYRNKRKLLSMLVILIIGNIIYYKLDNNTYITYLDVGQGDSIAIIPKNKKDVTLIDTGGSRYFDLSQNTMLYLKSLGINKIPNLIITHGDFDHMGEAINLVNNFKVENVIFNCGEYNELEKELIKVLNKKKIKYYSCIKELNIDKYKLQFLNTKEYDNENNNSNVIYFNYNDYKFLFMGDAGVEKEKDILDKYNLKDIYFLKVGHHGSNTSSSKYFIDEINPKYSLISVGKNNRYGHPKDEVLETLKISKIYRTDLDGSIEIKLNKNGYKIKTCPS